MLPVKTTSKLPAGKSSAFSRALKQFRKRTEPAPVTQATEVRRQESLDELYLPGRCTVTGQYYKTLFVRAPEDGRFVAVKRFKTGQAHTHEESAGEKDAGAAVMRRATIQSSDIKNWGHWPCPCCGKKLVHSQILCGRCALWTCTGRSYIDHDGEIIHVCHDDCGSRGGLRSSGTGYEFAAEIASSPQNTVPGRKPKLLTCDKHKALPKG